MAEAGSEVSFVATVRADPIQVAQLIGQALPSGGNYLEDTQVVPVGPTTFRITRRYMPQWAIIVGIIGLLLCLIGILAIFIRDTEELTIDIQPDPEGSKVAVSGKAKATMITTIQSTLARFEGFTPTSIGRATSGMPSGVEPTMSEDRAFWWDGAAWRDAMTSAPPQATRTPDGTHWWDGVAWRPLALPDPPGTGLQDSAPSDEV